MNEEHTHSPPASGFAEHGSSLRFERSAERWFKSPRACADCEKRVFCFPYAGATGDAVYAGWADAFDPEIELRTLQLPGHWGRMAEQQFRRLTPALDALYDAIVTELDKPFTFFGYSLGAALAFELARKIRDRLQLEPEHLYVAAFSYSGQRAYGELHLLEGDQLVAAVESLLGFRFPAALMDSPTLRRQFLEILRGDFELLETHQYLDGEPLTCPITCYAGSHDNAVPPESCSDWRSVTTGPFELRVVPGGHFFIDQLGDELARDVAQRLSLGRRG